MSPQPYTKTPVPFHGLSLCGRDGDGWGEPGTHGCL